MCQFLETINCKDGNIQRLQYHQARINNTLLHFHPQSSIDLATTLSIPRGYSQGDFRLRLVYSDCINTIEFFPVVPRQFNSFQLIEDNSIDYSYKFADRTALNKLIELKNGADEIIIVKNGYITDTSISNLLFFNEKYGWITSNKPLLRGTMRQLLLDRGSIKEKTISLDDLSSYSHIMMINALLEFNPDKGTPISSIRPELVSA